MGKTSIICFANQKGGVGKTTSAVNIAACLARTGKKVLFVDSDPQGNATSGLGIRKKDLGHNTYDLLIGRSRLEETVLSTAVKGLYVVPAGINLVGAELELVDEPQREYRLKNALSSCRNVFDYVIIDCPPSLGLLTINALAAADYVVIPVLCEYYSLEGLSQLTATIKQIKKRYNPDIELLGVLINMYDGRLNLTLAVMEEIKKYFSGKIFKTPIPRSVKISEAPSHGMAITDYDRNGKGAAAYSAVTNELIDRCLKNGG
ncbi:MAG: ParA family protein [Clostridia bacterium]|nr:ParA family protein [Clostridia bacterium]